MSLSPHLKIEPKEAQSAHSTLISLKALNPNLKVQKDSKFIYFPINKESLSKIKLKIKNAQFVNKKEIAQVSQVKKIKEPLKNKLSNQEFSHLLSSYDIVGDIAILEIADELKSKQLLIANEILNSNKKIKTVAVKSSATEGKFRIRKITPIAGEIKTNTISKESNCQFKIDINSAYYTNRFSTDRLDISSQIKENENILVLFSGVCPYPIVIEKHSNPNQIIAIELNPKAHKLAQENIKLNKCKKIQAINADVKKELGNPKYNNWAGRILMPHPSASMDFLPQAISAAKPNAIIHLYTFAPAQTPNAPFQIAEEIAKNIKSSSISLKLLNSKVVRPFSKEKSQVRLDLKVIKG